MIRRSSGLVSVLVLALVGAAVLERDAHGRRERERDALHRLEVLERADADLETSILELRSGALNYFDPIVLDVKALRNTADVPVSGGGDSARWQEAEVARLVADLKTKEQQVETLKTDHSLLRNSSLHFPVAAVTLAGYVGTTPAELDALRSTIARYLVAPSKTLSEEAVRQADALEASLAPADARAVAARQSVIGHARSIVERRMRVDDLVRDIQRSPARARIDELQAFHHRMESRAVIVVVAARTALVALALLAAVALGELLVLRRRAPRTARAPGS